MSKMNYKQIEHAQQRLSEVCRQLCGKPPVAPKEPEDREIIAEIAAGRRVTPIVLQQAALAWVTERNKTSRWDDPNFVALLGTELHHYSRTKEIAAYEKEKAKHDARAAKINVKYVEAGDEIVLGDCSRALELIKEFSKLTV